jgi:hypothetical protein
MLLHLHVRLAHVAGHGRIERVRGRWDARFRGRERRERRVIED